MTLPARKSDRHHLYYSSHADPMENMLRAQTLKSKSSYNINQYPLVASNQARVGGSRWTLAQPEAAGLMQSKQDQKNNTYYNNMIMYINNKQGDNDSTMSGLKAKQHLAKSRESLYSTMLTKEETERLRQRKAEAEECTPCKQCDSCCENCCCSFWSWILAILFAMFGFLGM